MGGIYDLDDIDHEATKWGRRTIAGVLLSCIALLAFTGHEPTDNGRRATPVVADASTDGRTHTCGLVTDQGVTEHLDEYAARCSCGR